MATFITLKKCNQKTDIQKDNFILRNLHKIFRCKQLRKSYSISQPLLSIVFLVHSYISFSIYVAYGRTNNLLEMYNYFAPKAFKTKYFLVLKSFIYESIFPTSSAFQFKNCLLLPEQF